jgi:protoheme ferro-lyase/glutamyl-tRNA reductase
MAQSAMPFPPDDATARPKTATRQRRAVLLMYLGAPPEGDAPDDRVVREQAAALESKLPGGMPVLAAMRYGHPSIGEALDAVAARGIEALVAVSMYPQYSAAVSRGVVRQLYREVDRRGCDIDVAVRSIWYDDAGYINAQARLLHEHARAFRVTPDDAHLVYAVRPGGGEDAEGGDPYVDQVHRTAELVSRRLGWPVGRSSVVFLDRAETALDDLLADGGQQVLVCPLSFVTECDWTRPAPPERRRRGLLLCPPLNACEPFVAALRNLVLYGRHPVSFGATAAGLMAEARARRARAEPGETPIASLFMVGVSLEGRLGHGDGPDVVAADPKTFRRIKRRQCDVPEILRGVFRDEAIREVWLWNTCRRFELYGWLNASVGDAERAEVMTLLQRQVFSLDPATAADGVNVLAGAEAWHYLLRTAAGLNSGLPGEREVLEQLQAAHRLAARAGTAGPLTDRLMADVVRHERRLRDQTEWGRITPSYCHAALAALEPAIGLDRPDCRCVVIGGSTTSCSVIEALAVHFGVPRRHITLLHRGHGHDGHLKMLRRAIGSGRRRRVHKYGERAVLEAIADADAVFIGLDRREPVLDADQVRGCRDFAARPLAIVDFNLFGSIEGLQDVDGIRVRGAAELESAAARYADELCGSEAFARAAEAAEAWIRRHVTASPVT